MISGLVGFTLGDLFLMKALTIVGARITMLVMALVPPITTLIGYFLLGETLSPRHYLGMVLTISGVAIVILTRQSGNKKLKYSLVGMLFALIGTVGQAVGLVLSKYGMGDYNAFAATQIRIIAGAAGFTILLFYLRAWHKLATTFKDKPALTFATVGTVFGPFLGVYLSLLAVQKTATGVASTIMSLVPVLIIPLSVLLFKEKVNAREILGALIAVTGVGIMFS